MKPTTLDSEHPVLVLFRNDRRLADNAALDAAARSGKPVIAAFVLEEAASGDWQPGGAWRWWLHYSLAALEKALADLGVRLVLRRGAMREVVDALVRESGADTVFWNRRYDPAGIAVDTRMKADLRDRGMVVQSFSGHLLHEPSRLATSTGGYYKVYSPFWKALMAGPEPGDAFDAPQVLTPFQGSLDSMPLAAFGLLPQKPDWAGGLRETWTPGEAGAHERLADFLSDALNGYAEGRDYPAKDATSLLSPYLAHGEITPARIFAALRSSGDDAIGADAMKFRKEVGWREFCYHLLFHNPDLDKKNFQPSFDAFPWHEDDASLRAWQRGMTGYPLVDAGMRELWQTGYMQNRVRMIAASFLTKHLLIDWRTGERWFRDTLVDADPASNPGNWQWVAGCGADAAPFFRIFNPVLQGQKFDPDGTYVRAWVPELAGLSTRYIHEPWSAPAAVLAQAGVKLGETYPRPVVDHRLARDRALSAHAETRSES
ncbi:deoxyribodipyrimidine photo-lyase [Pseudochelatococcus contaminans]|uniref:Deoxyribodipyrimidine photo-lyase n=1 Tax=Pseudochelatococcus contaminans TaxID=1538103 RepID=A0A7W5Z5Q1_9HYPH|nr:deoxyribodipyrimidine photo-lyase [Pseudochelatococcus contaminans]